jgi:hypothetical protein
VTERLQLERSRRIQSDYKEATERLKSGTLLLCDHRSHSFTTPLSKLELARRRRRLQKIWQCSNSAEDLQLLGLAAGRHHAANITSTRLYNSCLILVHFDILFDILFSRMQSTALLSVYDNYLLTETSIN